jgi:nucleoside-diphosphate kinase
LKVSDKKTKSENMKERTFVILKPDCIEKHLVADVIARLTKAGFEIVALKMAQLNESILQEHYAHIVGKPYYPPLVEFMQRKPVIMMVLEGVDVVAKVRKLLGPTNSQEAPAGTIRGDFGENTRENICHASDSVENAQIEIARFFKSEEVF